MAVLQGRRSIKREAHEVQVQHRSNRDLATLTVYTAERGPEETCADILARVAHPPTTAVSSAPPGRT